MKCCEKIGIRVINIVRDESCTQEELEEAIKQINRNDEIHGCLLFRPLPRHIDERKACELLEKDKDVDCITSASLNAVFTGKGDGFAPCTAQSVIEILDHYGYDPTGKQVVVIGRSLVIGKPVSMMLQARNATVTMCHTKTRNMPELCRRAEILVVAAGKAGVVDESFCNPEQVVIDVGININAEGKLCGDVLYDRVEPIVAALTPVPGGVGSVTSAVLCKHVLEAAERSRL